MTDAAVALDAVDLVRPFMISDGADKFPMAAKTIFLHDLLATFAHLDRIMEVLKGEVIRMPKAVFRLGSVFAD